MRWRSLDDGVIAGQAAAVQMMLVLEGAFAKLGLQVSREKTEVAPARTTTQNLAPTETWNSWAQYAAVLFGARQSGNPMTHVLSIMHWLNQGFVLSQDFPSIPPNVLPPTSWPRVLNKSPTARL